MLQDMRTYQMFQNDMVVIDRIIMKGRCVVIHKVLRKQALDKLHMNHMGI